MPPSDWKLTFRRGRKRSHAAKAKRARAHKQARKQGRGAYRKWLRRMKHALGLDRESLRRAGNGVVLPRDDDSPYRDDARDLPTPAP